MKKPFHILRHLHVALLFVATAFMLMVSSPSAQDRNDLLNDFDPTILTGSEARFLQAALAFEGYYRGLLDGKWGRRSQQAMQAYAAEEFDSTPRLGHMAALAYRFFTLNDSDGWQIQYDEPLGLSFLFPAKAIIKGSPSRNFRNWEHENSSLAFSLTTGDVNRTTRLHEFTLNQHASTQPPYTVRKPGFAVTSATKADGSVLYTRSDFVNGSWSTVMLSANKADGNLLQAVAASISQGFRPILSFPENGELARAIRLLVARIEEQNTGKTPTATKDRPISTGTGFVIDADGKVLTNRHVVADCRSIRVNGAPAQVLDMSKTFDLALLQAGGDTGMAVAAFAATPARLNADITVAGYPLNGLLGGLNVTRGAVSSLKGIQGDGIRMQISAPVQPGNSGGPVVNAQGAVVGVVVSKLNALQVAQSLGDIPQNVNFAIRGEIAQLFLAQNRVVPVLAPPGPRISPTDLADRLAGFTVLVSCQ